MSTLIRRISAAFSGGCLGGLINSLCVWIFGLLGITTFLGVKIAPAIIPAWLYPRIVWGGIWGILFLLPWGRGSVILRGLIFSLGPTAVQLLVVFPLKAQKGLLGLSLGALTPLFAVIFNAIWGIMAAWWIVNVIEE